MPRDRGTTQHGALPFAVREGELRILLITSRDTGRWLIPKGWPEKGMTPSELAAHEAFEEAGLVGSVGKHPIGSFEYLKKLSPRMSKRCRVMVFPLEVQEELEDWPESHERRREWVAPDEAARRIDEPELAALILDFAKPSTLRGRKGRA